MSYQSWFTDQPKRQWRSGLGAEGGSWRIKQMPLQEEDSDPRYDTFQRAWKNGASLSELFGNSTYALHRSVGPSGAENHRPDVTKVQAFWKKPAIWHCQNGDHRVGTIKTPMTPSGISNEKPDWNKTMSSSLPAQPCQP